MAATRLLLRRLRVEQRRVFRIHRGVTSPFLVVPRRRYVLLLSLEVGTKSHTARAGIHRAGLAARLPLSYNLSFLPLFANNIIRIKCNSLSASLSLEGTYSMNH